MNLNVYRSRTGLPSLYSSVLAGTLLLLSSLSLWGQGESGNREAKSTSAIRLSEESIDIDGRLNEPVWASAPKISDFQQKDPIEFGEPSYRTEVSFAYDEENLYVGATMWVDSREDVRTIVTRRDRSGPSDRIILSLDSYHDRLTAYSFSVTAGGVRTDYYHRGDEEYNRDYSFDPVWEAKTWVGEDRWTAEMRIPFSQLRFNDQAEQVWGLNINRYVPGKKEDIYWIVVPRNASGWSSRMGELRGITGLHPPLRIELMPYVAGDLKIDNGVDPDDPYTSTVDPSWRAGLDAKIGLGPNLTLDATINPDFGQVEADPAEVNLSGFETFFDERRPFFVAGSGLFDYEGATHYYTRRIGGAPHRFPSGSADFIDQPENTTILGAAKLTGRTKSGLSVGTLAAVTERERARLYDAATGEERKEEVEPMTWYGVSRVAQEFNDGSSKVGAIGTMVVRDMDDESPAARILAQEAITGGVDWSIELDDGKYRVAGNLAGSHVGGTEEAIGRIQRSSTHYFQRPDATYATYDPTHTSLDGYAGSIKLQRQEGKVIYGFGTVIESPGYELNDLGILGGAGDALLWGNLTYRQNRPGSFYQNWNVELNTDAEWSYERTLQRVNSNISLNITWPNFLYNYAGFGYGYNGLSDSKTRGGPLMDESDLTWNAWTGMGNNGGSRTRWYWHFGGGEYQYGGSFLNTYGGVATNIGSRLELSVDPKFYLDNEPRGYVGAVDGGGEETFGTRYIFANLAFRRTSLQFRINYALTPDLTLELYAEPFVATGSYTKYGELARAGSGEFTFYGDRMAADPATGGYLVSDGGEVFPLANPDFTYRSFRSNLVLRWEWLPGSSLYFVWQQNRENYQPTGATISPADWLTALGDDGTNVIALKMSYWLPVD